MTAPLATQLAEWPIWSWLDHSPLLQDFTAHYYPMGAALLGQPQPVFGYYYTAFFAVLLVPLGALPLPAAQLVWLALQGAVAALWVGLGLRLLPRPSLRAGLALAGLCALSLPVWHNLKWGQLSLALACAGVLSVLLERRGRPALAGAVLGVAAAIKFYPALLAVPLVWRQRQPALAGFVLAFGACYVLVPSLVLGFGAWQGFESAVGESIASADWVARDENSQHVPHVLRRLFALPAEAGGPWPSRLSALLGLGLLGWMLRQTRGHAQQLVLDLLAVWLCLPFLLQTSWPHYFAWLPLGQLWLWQLLVGQRRAQVWVVASVVASAMPVFVLAGNWRALHGHGLLLGASLLLGQAWWCAVRQPPGTAAVSLHAPPAMAASPVGAPRIDA